MEVTDSNPGNSLSSCRDKAASTHLDLLPCTDPQHEEEENSRERNKCWKKFFTINEDRQEVMHGSSTPLLQKLALKLIVQYCTSSHGEKNWRDVKNTTTGALRSGTLLEMCGMYFLDMENDAQGGDEIDTIPISRQ
ncbi:hypothetical protein V8G54_002759 [Vigna mungo]|uniref:Uncharacterized protein n=1 Tax=Vigna mungo TaxID=3915 RepID=A0AAQ3PBK0_VIGMU